MQFEAYKTSRNEIIERGDIHVKLFGKAATSSDRKRDGRAGDQAYLTVAVGTTNDDLKQRE